MMLVPYTEYQKTIIINNIVSACEDIMLLNKVGYNFIHACNGFLAHYNLTGFKMHYSRAYLDLEILRNASINKFTDVLPGDDNYNYYMSRKDIYTQIVSKLIANQI